MENTMSEAGLVARFNDVIMRAASGDVSRVNPVITRSLDGTCGITYAFTHLHDMVDLLAIQRGFDEVTKVMWTNADFGCKHVYIEGTIDGDPVSVALVPPQSGW